MEDLKQKIATGISVKKDVHQAAKEFVTSFGRQSPEAVFFFASSCYDIEQLGQAISGYYPDTQVIGCTTSGEINSQGCLHNSLCGFALPRDSFSIATTCLHQLTNFDLQKAQTQVSDLFSDLSERSVAPQSGHSFAFLLIDGLTGLEEIVLSAVQGEIGDIPLFGGSAGDDLHFRNTQIFHDGKAHDDVAVLCVINTLLPFKVFRTQHFVEGDRKMVITSADVATRKVSEINGASAGKEYARLVGIEYDRLDPMTFASHPVMVRVGGSYYVRSIRQLAEDDSLSFFCAIDEGIVLTVAKGVDLVENLSQTFSEITQHIGEPQLVIGCDCVFRQLEYKQNPRVTEQVEKLFKSHNVIGFNTYGEQFDGMHVNQTFTGVAIGYPQNRDNS